MRALEINAEYFGISLLQLMENAGRSVAQEIADRFEKDQHIAIFCGLGGNGGDGFVAARHLLSLGFGKVTVVVAGHIKDINHESAKRNWLALQPFNANIEIREINDAGEVSDLEADVVVDALLGTGTKGKLRPPVSNLVALINGMKAFKVAVDIPTGIDSDTGEVLGEAVKADLTITFYQEKSGFKKSKSYIGKLVVAEIGLPHEIGTYVGPGDVQLITKMRKSSAHKGDSGKILLVGGSEVYSGAPVLMSMAALRTGVDLAYTASPEKTAHDIASLSPDLISIKLEGDYLNPGNVDALKPYLRAVDAVVMGPGLGLREETKQFVKLFVKTIEEEGRGLLLDADGLKAFAEFKRKLKVPFVLTPHSGEYAILTGKRLPDDVSERIKCVKQTAQELGAVILLKGAVDIISDGSQVKLNFAHNPGMTVGGTGDVLSGIVGGFLAQKTNAFEAASAGAFVNGAAGDFVAANIGFHMVATDLLDYIPDVLNDPMSHLKVRNGGKST